MTAMPIAGPKMLHAGMEIRPSIGYKAVAPAHRAAPQARPTIYVNHRRRKCRTIAEQGTPATQQKREQPPLVKRSMFPKEFIFGTATSAYQARREQGSAFLGSCLARYFYFCHAVVACSPMHTRIRHSCLAAGRGRSG